MSNGARRLFATAVIVLSGFVIAPDVRAADAGPGFSVEGQVSQPLHLTVADLKQKSGIQIDAAFEGKNGPEKNSYVGVSLADLLDQAKVVDGDGKGAHMRHIIEVTGRDGYQTVISMGEIDPFLEGKAVMIAYLRDGKPLDPPDSVKLVVPGDHHGARGVRDVVKIEVK